MANNGFDRDLGAAAWLEAGKPGLSGWPGKRVWSRWPVWPALADLDGLADLADLAGLAGVGVGWVIWPGQASARPESNENRCFNDWRTRILSLLSLACLACLVCLVWSAWPGWPGLTGLAGLAGPTGLAGWVGWAGPARPAADQKVMKSMFQHWARPGSKEYGPLDIESNPAKRRNKVFQYFPKKRRLVAIKVSLVLATTKLGRSYHRASTMSGTHVRSLRD